MTLQAADAPVVGADLTLQAADAPVVGADLTLQAADMPVVGTDLAMQAALLGEDILHLEVSIHHGQHQIAPRPRAGVEDLGTPIDAPVVLQPAGPGGDYQPVQSFGLRLEYQPAPVIRAPGGDLL